MSLKPTGHRVLVKPDEPPAQTDSGLLLPQDHDHVSTSGTIVAVGPGGSLMRYQARQRAIRDCCEVLESCLRTWGAIAPLLVARDEVAGLLGTSDREREVKVGDRVAFAAEVGLQCEEDGQPYLILNEDDVAVIVEELESVA